MDEGPGLSVSIAVPLWMGTARVEDLLRFDNYGHVIRAFGGFHSAGFSLPEDQMDAEAWLGSLGYDVTVYDEALDVCWNGFINRVTVSIGPRAFILGPFLDIANKVAVTYGRLITVTEPPTRMGEETTAFGSDVASQALYGIRERIVSGSDQTDAAAAQARDTFLAENAWPQPTHQAASRNPGVSVEMLGYYHLLGFLYSQTALVGNVDLSNDDGTGKLQLVIAADPNSIFSTSWIHTDDNTTPQPRQEQDNRTALAIIQGMTALGDASNNRWLYGVYEERLSYYEQAPSTVAYTTLLCDPAQKIRTLNGQEVPPWRVRPGRWLEYQDFLVGDSPPTSLGQDLRYEFLDSVSYRWPYGLDYEGGRTDRIPQLLARKGLGGTYA